MSGVVVLAIIAGLAHGITDFSLSYRSSLQSASNEICFAFTLSVAIPRAGGLSITGPPGFVFATACEPKSILAELPFDASCRSRVPAGSDSPVVTITAGPDGIEADSYEICLGVTNPSDQTVKEGVFTSVWTINSYSVVSEETNLEASAQVASFKITRPMVSGGVVQQPRNDDCKGQTPQASCTMEEISYYWTDKNERPGQYNWVVLEFKLDDEAYADTMRILAPEGFVFDASCQFETNSALVFNAYNALGFDQFLLRYSQWPASPLAVVSGCTGSGNVAELSIAQGFLYQRNYVLRIKVKNPAGTPDYNNWRIEYNLQTNTPSEGFAVWVMTGLLVVAQDASISSITVPTQNRVQIQFTTNNAIPYTGRVAIQAPTGFLLATNCQASIATKPAVGTGSGTAVAVLCIGAAQPTNTAAVTFTSGDGLAADTAYVLTFTVTNPQTVGPARLWTLYSYETADTATLLDTGYVTGFGVNLKVPLFQLVSASNLYGNTPVSLTFQVKFGEILADSDTVALSAPLGFSFNSLGERDCQDYRLLPVSGVSGPQVIERNKPVCSGNVMRFTVKDGSVAANTLWSWVVGSVNPALTPVTNLFTVKHVKVQNGEIRESRVITGYSVVPQLAEVAVTLDTPVVRQSGGSSRVLVSFLPVSSATSVRISGYNSVSGEGFDLSKATLSPASSTGVTISSKSVASITLATTITAGVRKTIGLANVVNSAVAGVSAWDVATFVGESKKDERIGQLGFEVLSQFALLSSSTLSPSFYSTLAATVTLRVRSAEAILVGDVLEITAPTGFDFADNSFVAISGISSVDHGLISSNMYYIKLATEPIVALTEVTFILLINLPATQPVNPNWGINAKRGSSSGAVVATNDSLFAGFQLVGRIPFTISPSSLTPGATVDVRVSFSVATAITGTNTVSLQVTAPAGFRFSSGSSCLKNVVGVISAFQTCMGNNNVATLTTNRPTLSTGLQQLVLIATNPSATPTLNTWRLGLYLDQQSGNFRNLQEGAGYGIEAMTVIIDASNMLGVSSGAFFTFIPGQTVTTSLFVQITPPAGAGYVLNCQPAYQVGLSSAPACTGTGEVNAAVKLSLAGVPILQDVGVSVGVAMFNPGAAPDSNNFQVVLMDKDNNVADANMNVPGEVLLTSAIRAGSFGWSSVVEAYDVATVQISFSVTRQILLDLATVIVVTAPEDVVFSSPDAVRTSEGFPVADVAPVSVMGNLMYVRLSTTRTFDPQSYSITFNVKNPAALPNKNVWLFSVTQDGKVIFQHAYQGYRYGQSSPVTVQANLAVSSALPAAIPSALTLGTAAALVLISN